MGNFSTYIVVVGLITLLGVLAAVFRSRANKKAAGNYLALYADAAKVFLTDTVLMTNGAVTVHSIDGNIPAFFTESGKSGVYVRPGDTPAVISYSYSTGRRSTTTTGSVNTVLKVAPQRSYMLGFDRDKQEFTFTEI